MPGCAAVYQPMAAVCRPAPAARHNRTHHNRKHRDRKPHTRKPHTRKP